MSSWPARSVSHLRGSAYQRNSWELLQAVLQQRVGWGVPGEGAPRSLGGIGGAGGDRAVGLGGLQPRERGGHPGVKVVVWVGVLVVPGHGSSSAGQVVARLGVT